MFWVESENVYSSLIINRVSPEQRMRVWFYTRTVAGLQMVNEAIIRWWLNFNDRNSIRLGAGPGKSKAMVR